MKSRNIICGFLGGLGKMADPIGTLLGEYYEKQGKENYYLVGHLLNKDMPEEVDKDSLEFKILRCAGEFIGVSLNVLNYGLLQGAFGVVDLCGTIYLKKKFKKIKKRGEVKNE